MCKEEVNDEDEVHQEVQGDISHGPTIDRCEILKGFHENCYSRLFQDSNSNLHKLVYV